MAYTPTAWARLGCWSSEILDTNTRFSRDYEFILIDTWEDMRTIIAIVDPAYEITGEIYEHENKFEDIVESITGDRDGWGFSADPEKN